MRVFGGHADNGFGDYVAVPTILCTLMTSQRVRVIVVTG